MHPIDFPQTNTIWAKDQPEYLELPSWRDDRETISLWRLTWRERFQVLYTGTLWLRQLNFGEPLQPQRPSVDNPFPEPADAP